MGKILSIMVRQSRRVFVQERAERIISKPKPTMHPFYPTEEKFMKQIKAQHPELEEKIKEHRPALDERVGGMRITSKTVPLIQGGRPIGAIEAGEGKEVRLLPQQRMAPEEAPFGFHEPPLDKVPPGRMLFSKAMQLLEKRENKDQADQFAKQFGLNDTEAKAILDYFAPFTLSADLEDPKKKLEYDEEREKLTVGHRVFLQRHRLVSELEQQRITARIGPNKTLNSGQISGPAGADEKS